MQQFFMHFRTPGGIERAISPLSFNDVEAAYLDACEALPEFVGEMLRKRIDPFDCAVMVCDLEGRNLFEVTCLDLLKKPKQRPEEELTADGTVHKGDKPVNDRSSAIRQRVIDAYDAMQGEMAKSRAMISEALVSMQQTDRHEHGN